MKNPSAFALTFARSAFLIGAPGTYYGDWIDDLEGMRSVSLQAKFMYGAGGESVNLYIQTSLDQGQTPIDIWAQQFTDESESRAVNLHDDAVTSPVTPTVQGLAPGTCVNGILGDRLRAVAVVSGNFTGTTLLNVTAVAR